MLSLSRCPSKKRKKKKSTSTSKTGNNASRSQGNENNGVSPSSSRSPLKRRRQDEEFDFEPLKENQEQQVQQLKRIQERKRRRQLQMASAFNSILEPSTQQSNHHSSEFRRMERKFFNDDDKNDASDSDDSRMQERKSDTNNLKKIGDFDNSSTCIQSSKSNAKPVTLSEAKTNLSKRVTKEQLSNGSTAPISVASMDNEAEGTKTDIEAPSRETPIDTAKKRSKTNVVSRLPSPRPPTAINCEWHETSVDAVAESPPSTKSKNIDKKKESNDQSCAEEQGDCSAQTSLLETRSMDKTEKPSTLKDIRSQPSDLQPLNTAEEAPDGGCGSHVPNTKDGDLEMNQNETFKVNKNKTNPILPQDFLLQTMATSPGSKLTASILEKEIKAIFASSSFDFESESEKSIRKQVMYRLGIDGKFPSDKKALFKKVITQVVQQQESDTDGDSSNDDTNQSAVLTKKSASLNSDWKDNRPKKLPSPNEQVKPKSDSPAASDNKDRLDTNGVSKTPKAVDVKPTGTELVALPATPTTTNDKPVPEPEVVVLHDSKDSRPPEKARKRNSKKAAKVPTKPGNGADSDPDEKASKVAQRGKGRGRKGLCALCTTCPCRKPKCEDRKETLGLQSFARSDGAMEKALIRRLKRIEKSSESLNDQQEMIKRKLKKLRRDILRKKISKSSEGKDESYFLPDAEELESCERKPPRVADDWIAEAQRRMFGSTNENYQPSLTQLGFSSSKSKKSIEDSNPSKMQTIAECEDETESHDENVECLPPDESDDSPENEKQMECDEESIAPSQEMVEDGEMTGPSSSFVEPHRISWRNGLKVSSPLTANLLAASALGGLVMQGEAMEVFDDANSVLSLTQDERPMGKAEQCPWDSLFSDCAMGDDEIDDMDQLVELINHGQSSSRANSEFDLSQRGEITAGGLMMQISSNARQVEALNQVCPNWKENVSFAFGQSKEDVQVALLKLQKSSMRLERTKEKILEAWERNKLAMDVFKETLEKSLDRFKA